MKIVIQRVTAATVTIENIVNGQIDTGMLILLGIEQEDDQADADWLIQKVIGLRIFNDSEGKMNLSVDDVNGAFLVVSQFTLHASIKKGNRPSYIQSAKPEHALPLYEYFLKTLKINSKKKVESGKFGADMKVNLLNDGPVTIIIDTKNKE